MASISPPIPLPPSTGNTGSFTSGDHTGVPLEIVYDLPDEIDILGGEAELLWSLLGNDIMECLEK